MADAAHWILTQPCRAVTGQFLLDEDVLRAAGVPVGPDRVLLALEALEQVGVSRRDDVKAALGAVMLDRHEQQPIFDAAFAAFWRARMQARMRADPSAIIAECPGISDGEDLPVAYRVTPRGLMVMGVNTSSAGAACNQDLAEISLADLAPFLAPGAAAYWD